MKEINDDGFTELSFEIIGAGDLRISESNQCQSGGKSGFSIGVSWTKYPYSGGLIPNDEAIKLAKHILKRNNL